MSPSCFRIGLDWTWVLELVNDRVHPGLLSPATGKAVFLLHALLSWSQPNTSSALKNLEDSLAWHLRPSSSKAAQSLILLRKLLCVSYSHTVSKRFPGHWPAGKSFRELFLQVSEWVSEWKSLSRVQLFVTLRTSLPSSSVHGILQARILEWVATALLEGIFPTQGSNLVLLHWQADSLLTEPPGKPKFLQRRTLSYESRG